MALTITEKFRGSQDGKAMRVYDITHDGNVASITATQMDLHYIEAIAGYNVYLSMDAYGSEVMNMMHVSINAANSGVTWAAVMSNAISNLTVIGW